MRVTDHQYPMEDAFVKKADEYIARITKPKPKLDAGIIVDGKEGYGKTTFSIGYAYYVSQKTGRKYDVDHVFFDVDKMLEFARKTKEQIIHWDELAISGLSVDWRSKTQIKLWKFLQVARKKRHFYIFCIPRIFSLKDFLIERTQGLVHVYARHEKEFGRFTYYPTKKKELLYSMWKKTRKKTYKLKYMGGCVRGSFSDVLDKDKEYNLLDVFDFDTYDKRKDEIIEEVGGKEQKNTQKIKLIRLQYKVACGMDKLMKKNRMTQEECAKIFGFQPQNFRDWKEYAIKYPDLLGIDDK